MREKARRVDTARPTSAAQQLVNSGPSLASNPFSELRVETPECLAAAPARTPANETKSEFRIARTKKGGWPISLEKRGAGKTVTIIRNVCGDTGALLALLKKRCAAGGKAFEDSVEVQGDHRERIDAFLRERGI